MSKFSSYLERHQQPEILDLLSDPDNRSSLFVTIPCYDEPNLPGSLSSLAACDPPASALTVIVVVNASDKSSPQVLLQNQNTIQTVITWREKQSTLFFRLRLLHAPALPSKWAGVGWARKIAMDEAVRTLDQSGIEGGILIAFDADSTVSTNYFTSIEKEFLQNPSYNFVTLNFCHPVDDPSLTTSLREGIIHYELYLRYLRNAMEWGGYPHAIHTIGSSFAVKAEAYVKQGGMNRRQAGEDFHFLHKMVLLGHYGMAGEATVFPSCRISHRVPFGTGAALMKWEAGDQELYSSYALPVFRSLQPLLHDPVFFFKTGDESWAERIAHLDQNLRNYITVSKTIERLKELKKNCADATTFARRFYHEISAFWIIQYLNWCEQTVEGKGNLVKEATKLLAEIKKEEIGERSARSLLEIFRQIDNP